jgi:putative heme-binding domain-containing protein
MSSLPCFNDAPVARGFSPASQRDALLKQRAPTTPFGLRRGLAVALRAKADTGVVCAAVSIFLLAILPIVAAQCDIARGKALVESSKCLDCHRIADVGSRVGPDLSDIGKLRSPDQLHRAIVAPDDDVLPEHRSVRVVTREGKSVVGRLLNQDAFSIQLIDAEEQLKSFVKSNLREHAILEKGLMPSYKEQLTPQQLTDMVAYLGSLVGVEK